MFSTLEVFVHVGPVSLAAMSQLDWEKDLLKGEDRSSCPRRQLSIEVGPVRVSAHSNSRRSAEIHSPARVSADVVGKEMP